MIYEVVENAIDEALAVKAPEVTVTLNGDGSCTVTDNGLGLRACDGAMLNTPGSGSFRWVGVEVVIALSTWCMIRTCRKGMEYVLAFREGEVAETPRAQAGDAGNRPGTEVTFLPSTSIFTNLEFDAAKVSYRLNELALQSADVRISLTDNRHPEHGRAPALFLPRFQFPEISWLTRWPDSPV